MTVWVKTGDRQPDAAGHYLVGEVNGASSLDVWGRMWFNPALDERYRWSTPEASRWPPPEFWMVVPPLPRLVPA